MERVTPRDLELYDYISKEKWVTARMLSEKFNMRVSSARHRLYRLRDKGFLVTEDAGMTKLYGPSDKKVDRKNINPYKYTGWNDPPAT